MAQPARTHPAAARRRIAGATLALALAAGLGWQLTRRNGALGSTLAIETVATDLAAALPADGPARRGQIAPRRGLVNDGPRDAIVVPVESAIALPVAVPEGGVLDFGIGVEGDGKKDRDAAGIRFRVLVDGLERFARTLNPAAAAADRTWVDARLDLGAVAGRTVTITLATAPSGPGRPAGRPGWSRARLLGRRFVPRQDADPARPNVLVLLVDTLRSDRLGCYGGPAASSPTLDRLAARGIVFAENVSHAPWTMPSTASILTGLEPPAHGALGDQGQTLADALTTFPELARAAGISTMGVSTNPLVSRGTNFDQGFETFVELDLETGEEAGEVVKTPATAAAANATFLRWLRPNRGRRFLAYLHYMEPHHPYTPAARHRPAPPPDVRPRVATGRLDPWQAAMRQPVPFQLPPHELAHVRALYDAEIRSWDDALAQLLADLAALGVLDSTVIVVTADHGEAFQEHGRLQHGFHLYDELLRVPLVITGPGIAPRRVSLQTMGVDVLPTVTALLGVPAPAGLPGRNVLQPFEERPAFAVTLSGRLPDGRGAELVSLRTSARKVIAAPASDFHELFDLQADSGEQRNRWGDDAEASTLGRRLLAWRAAAHPPGTPPAVDPAFAERLRALGYAE